MKEYENPTITISMFDMENVVTASGTSAASVAQEALNTAGVKTSNTTQVTWQSIIAE